MKVLIVSRGVKPLSSGLTGGAEYVLLNHARGLARLGHQVHVVSDVEPDLREEPDIAFHPVGVNRTFADYCRGAGFALWILLHLWGNLLAFWAALMVLRSERQPFDIVHCHGNFSGLLLSLFYRASPILYTEHDSTPWTCFYPSVVERAFRRLTYRLFDVALFRRASRSIMLYEGHKLEVQRRWRVPAERVLVIPNGVDERLFSPSDILASIYDEDGVPDRPFCLFVGRLEPRKGVDVLLMALEKCSVSCVIVGNGPERKRLEALSSELSLNGRVTFAGTVKNGSLMRYYRDASFFVIPSYSEAFPLTVLEAMACGRPVVATKVGAMPALVDSSRCGLLSDPGDPDALAQNMAALAADAEKARALGANGRESVLRSYTWSAVALKLEAIYREVAAAEQAPSVAAGEQVAVGLAPRQQQSTNVP